MIFSKKQKTVDYEFIFVFSTGRCGTKHLSQIFGDKDSVVFHEKEHDNDNYKVLREFLLPIAKDNNRELAIQYVKEHRIPFMLSELKKSKARKYFETGHLINYGVTPFLLSHIENIKFIRVRRDRYEVAKSFMTRDESMDIWNSDPHSTSYRWSLHPKFSINTLPPKNSIWKDLNRFQRYLWSIDELERQWQRLVSLFQFDYMEVKTENFGNDEYKRISDFIGISYNSELVGVKHNTTAEKGFEKPELELDTMIYFDQVYQRLING